MTGRDGDGREPGRDRPTDGDGPTAAPTPAAQLAARDSGTAAPLTDQEIAVAMDVAGWFAGACVTKGVVPPPDLIRALLYCAAQVWTYNMALDQQAQAEADANAPRH
jgi:hypothetical protein